MANIGPKGLKDCLHEITQHVTIFYIVILKSGVHRYAKPVFDQPRSFSRIVDFVLRDPRETDEDKEVVLPSHREELAVVPKPWHRSYVASLEVAQEHLHTINMCMLQVLQLWHMSFRLGVIFIFYFRIYLFTCVIIHCVCLVSVEYM